MTLCFDHQAQPIRVLFGAGRFAELAGELDRLGLKRVIVLSTPGKRALAEKVAALIGSRCGGIHDRCQHAVPIESVQEAARAAAELDADGTVCIGGGSTIGHGKWIKYSYGGALVHVVTTYSGSEMTAYQGVIENGAKRRVGDPKMLADSVIYDPALTLELPPGVSGPSGMNALAHAVGALANRIVNPLLQATAMEAIRAMHAGLPRAVAEPEDMEGREQALLGAWLCGMSLGVPGGLQHQLAHVLGGTYGVTHALAHAIVLPHSAAYNRPEAVETMRRAADLLGADSLPRALFDLGQAVGIEMTLESQGITPAQLDEITDIVVADPYPNLRPVEREAVRALLQDAFDGKRPV